MDKGQRGVGSRYFRMIFTVGPVGDLTDAQLLERFNAAEGGDSAEMAFSALVERHGPMILHVCRSVLRDPDAAHDAFQATFLVLVRRAGSLWVKDSLGPWLHQVAYRVASNARSASARRQRHERRAAELSGPLLGEDNYHDPGVGDVLHYEVNRLSRGCRSAVVLCYFEGLSPEQAARQLGCPVGTVQSRLARGRAKLRTRLTRRGLVPSLGPLGIGVAEAAPIALPASLVATTTRSAMSLSMASSAVAVSGSVTQLMQGALTSMFLIKLRTIAISVLAIVTLAAGAGSMGIFQDAPPRIDLLGILNEQGSVSVSVPKPKIAAKSAGNLNSKASPGPSRRIYTNADLDGTILGMLRFSSFSVVAIDPETGKATKVHGDNAGRLRISPNGQRGAYVSGSLRILSLDGGSRPEVVVPLEHAKNGGLASWSADGKRLIVSTGTCEKNKWVNETFRINADGSAKTPLKIPPEDTVQDWSSDGEWLLTASSRNAKFGWQLYIMRPDGTDQRQITDGGNPFYARFSPDGKRVLYSDHAWKLSDHRGIWVVDSDGKNRRLVFEIARQPASACWSPDGKRIAVAVRGAEPTEKGRLEIVDLESGAHRALLTMPGQEIADMPDWR